MQGIVVRHLAVPSSLPDRCDDLAHCAVINHVPAPAISTSRLLGRTPSRRSACFCGTTIQSPQSAIDRGGHGEQPLALRKRSCDGIISAASAAAAHSCKARRVISSAGNEPARLSRATVTSAALRSGGAPLPEA